MMAPGVAGAEVPVTVIELAALVPQEVLATTLKVPLVKVLA